MDNYDRATPESSIVSFSRKAVWPVGLLIMVLFLLNQSPIPLHHVFNVVFLSVLLAAAVAPAGTFMWNRFRVPRPFTILALYGVGFAVLAGMVALLVPLVQHEVSVFDDKLPVYLDTVQGLVARVSPEHAQQLESAQLAKTLAEHLNTAAAELTSLAKELVSMTVDTMLILFIAFLLAAEPDLSARFVRRWVPAHHEAHALKMLSSMGTQLGHWARAQLILAIVFGVAFGIGLQIIGVKYALTLGLIGATLEIIPYVGGFTTLVLALLVALTQNPILAVLVVGLYVVVTWCEGHLLAPKLMDRVIGLPPLLVVLAIFIGEQALGVMGALMALPIAVVLKVLLDNLYDPRGALHSSAPTTPAPTRALHSSAPTTPAPTRALHSSAPTTPATSAAPDKQQGGVLVRASSRREKRKRRR